MSAWKPGDVVVVAGMRAYYTDGDEGPMFTFADGSRARADVVPADPGHRRVVIDPENQEEIERLVQGYFDGFEHSPTATRIPPQPDHLAAMTSALSKFANPQPVKPEEPTGLGAVVVDEDDRIWIHDPTTPTTHNWHSRGVGRAWHNVAAVRVLSDGWAQELDEPLAEWERRLLDECCDRGPCALKRGHQGRCHA